MPDNLTALRELALRRTAQRVDAQMVDYMRAHAIAGPWEASERLLVAVNARPRCGFGNPLCKTAGGPAARLLDRGPYRDRRRQRSRARPSRPGAAPGRTHGRGGG